MRYFILLLLSAITLRAETNVMYAHFAAITERAKAAYTFNLEGKDYVTPGGGYVQSYVRDAAMLATSGFLSAQEIKDHLELYLLVQQLHRSRGSIFDKLGNSCRLCKNKIG